MPPEQRSAHLDVHCGPDSDLRDFVERLLGNDSPDGETLLSRPLFRPAGLESGGDDPPQSIGGYRVLREIGQGGMGVVYEAQHADARRTVALKVIRCGFPSREMRRRFEFEAEVLGRLHHPAIAQIYEAGSGDATTARGQRAHLPYFAMEFIEGRPLLRYVNGHDLPNRQRLELLARVCDAVNYAHQQGVIHRDLKPGNILVTAAGQPKILDFGVARIVRRDCGGQDSRTAFTGVGQLLGTLPYMSPEQLSGDPDQIDTRTDVYSLGVILYELLCGRLPYNVEGQSLPQAARTVCETQLVRLAAIDRRLRGDLDTVVTRALEKDKARRYQTAAELADDIRRYLRGEPVGALRDSVLYVLRKAIARYRWPAAVAGVSLLSLAGFAIYTSVQAERNRVLAERERQARMQAVAAQTSAETSRQLAQREADRAAAVKSFLQRMLTATDPAASQGGQTKLRFVLDDAGRELEQGLLADQPEVEAEVRETLAQTYFHLGLFNSAAPHFEWLRGHCEGRYGESDRRTLRVLERLGRVYSEAGRYSDAKLAFDRCLKLALAAHPDDAELTLAAMNGLGRVLMQLGRPEAAEPLNLEALGGVQHALGEDHDLFARATFNLGSVYHEQGRLAEAEQLYRRALDVTQRLHGEDSYEAIRLRWHLARDILMQTDRAAEAEGLLRETLELATRKLGDEHTATNAVLIELSHVLAHQQRPDEAERLLRDAVAGFRDIRAVEVEDTMAVVGELANLLATQGRDAEAIALLEEGLARATRLHGDGHRVVAMWLAHLAKVNGDSGDYVAALDAARRGLELRRRLFGDEHETVATSLQQMGWYCARLDRPERVEFYRQAFEMRKKLLGDTHPDTIQSTITLAFSLRDMGRGDEGPALLRDRYRRVRDELGPAHESTQWAGSYLATLLSSMGRHDAAIEVSRGLLDAVVEQFGPQSRAAAVWSGKLARFLSGAGRTEEASRMYRQASSVYAANRLEQSASALVDSYRFADVLLDLGQATEARALAARAVAQLPQSVTDRSALVFHSSLATCALARAILATGEPQDAAALLQECLAGLDGAPLNDRQRRMIRARAELVMGACHSAAGRFSEAESLLIRAHRQIAEVEAEITHRARAEIAALYGAWHAAEPSSGHDRRVAEWRAPPATQPH